MYQVRSKNKISSDEELLKQVIESPEKAKSIREKFSLMELANAHRPELELCNAEYGRLMAAIELGRRVNDSFHGTCRTKISSSSDAIDFCRSHFANIIREATQEEFHMITLSTKNTVIDTHCITIGTLDASLVHPREVFRPAIRDCSSSIILAHNHPSGDPTPSREDKAVTDRLENAGEILGITVLDHIVMGRNECVSIRERR